MTLKKRAKKQSLLPRLKERGLIYYLREFEFRKFFILYWIPPTARMLSGLKM